MSSSLSAVATGTTAAPSDTGSTKRDGDATPTSQLQPTDTAVPVDYGYSYSSSTIVRVAIAAGIIVVVICALLLALKVREPNYRDCSDGRSPRGSGIGSGLAGSERCGRSRTTSARRAHSSSLRGRIHPARRPWSARTTGRNPRGGDEDTSRRLTRRKRTSINEGARTRTPCTSGRERLHKQQGPA